MRFLQQPCTVQRRLRDESIIIIFTEDLRALERADDQGDSLELRTTLRYAVLVYREGLHVKVVREVLEPALVRYLSGKEGQAEGY